MEVQVRVNSGGLAYSTEFNWKLISPGIVTPPALRHNNVVVFRYDEMDKFMLLWSSKSHLRLTDLNYENQCYCIYQLLYIKIVM